MGIGRRLVAAAGRSVLLAAVIAGLVLAAPGGSPRPAPQPANASTLVAGFEETEVISGLTNPTVVRFASDGRVFVAEKSGLIKVFSDLSDPSPTVFADLRTNVHNFWDRGLLGAGARSELPLGPLRLRRVHVQSRARVSEPAAPLAGLVPDAPGATTDGCVVSGRLSRLQAAGDVMTGSEQVLIEDWCQQYPSHSVGALQFGPDGALYLSSGDGASFTFSDYGQEGIPPNPCGDPPGGVGTPLELPTAEGGALRSQDLRTSGDPATLDGTVIRVDPATGDALPSNPLFGSSDENVRRIIAYGQRQSFRFTFRPGTDELWVGEVGWGDYEEINRVLSPTDAEVENFGWPCYEGTPRGIFDDADFTICEDLYDDPGAHTAPVLRVPALRPGRPRRELPGGNLLDLGDRLQLRFHEQLPHRVRGRALLRRLFARLHLGDAHRWRRAAVTRAAGDLRGRGSESRQSRVRARRRALLRRLRRRRRFNGSSGSRSARRR